MLVVKADKIIINHNITVYRLPNGKLGVKAPRDIPVERDDVKRRGRVG